MHAIAQTCPSCGEPNIHPGRWHLRDLTLLFHLLRPVCCDSCGDRFCDSLFQRKDALPNSEAITREESKDFVLHIRFRNPGRVMRTLLSWTTDPVPPRRVDWQI